MSDSGRVLDVNPVTIGDELAVDTPAGATVLELVDVGDFDEDGGTLALGDEILTYSATDDDAGTVTLDEPTTVDAAAGDRVLLWDTMTGAPAVEWTAMVLLDDSAEGDPIEASISHELIDAFAAGIRDVLEGESVVLERDDSDVEIVNILGKQLTRDLSFADPTTVPDPVATVKPEASPTIQVYGRVDGFTIDAEQLAATTTVLQYHVSTVDGFTPDESTALGSPTRSSVVTPSTLPNGSPFKAERNYFFTVVAFNTAGAADPAPIVSARLDPTAVRRVVADDVVAVEVVTRALQAAAIAVGIGTISADDGIQVPDVVSIPFNGDPMDFYGFARLTGATVLDDLNIYELARLVGRMVAANGIPDPRVKSTASRDWERIPLTLYDGSPAGTSLMHGLAYDGGDWWTGSYFDGPVLQSFDETTGALGLSVGCTGSHVSPAFAVDGYTRLGGVNYFLGRDSDRTGRRFLYAFDDTGAKLSEWEYTSDSSSPYQPTLGNDGTNLVIARCIATGEVRVRRYDPTTMATVGSILTTGHSPARDLTGVYWGSADFGAPRVVVSFTGGFYVYDPFSSPTPGVRMTGGEWQRASNTPARVFGWDGTRFAHIDDSGRLWLYQDGHPTTTSVDHCYAWVDTDGGTPWDHTTAHSDTATFSWPARSRLTINAQAAPDAGVHDPALHDLAKNTAVFAGPAGGTMRLQAILDPGASEWTQTGPLDTASTVAPTTNGFPAAVAPGSFESDATDDDGEALAYLRGGGTFRAMKSRQSSVRVIGPFTATGAANELTVDVEFPVPFDATPNVRAWAAGDPDIFKAWVTGESATGFTLHAYRTAGLGAFTARWTAEDRTS